MQLIDPAILSLIISYFIFYWFLFMHDAFNQPSDEDRPYLPIASSWSETYFGILNTDLYG